MGIPDWRRRRRLLDRAFGAGVGGPTIRRTRAGNTVDRPRAATHGTRESNGADTRNLLSRPASARDCGTRGARRPGGTGGRRCRCADLVRAGSELASAASSVIARLGMRGDAFPTILAGGIFRGVPSLRATSKRACRKSPHAASSVRCSSSPRSEPSPRVGCGARRGEGALLRLTARGHPHFRQPGPHGSGGGAACRRRACARTSAGARLADGAHFDWSLRTAA